MILLEHWNITQNLLKVIQCHLVKPETVEFYVKIFYVFTKYTDEYLDKYGNMISDFRPQCIEFNDLIINHIQKIRNSIDLRNLDISYYSIGAL